MTNRVLVLALFAFASASGADTFQLNTGVKFDGEILKQENGVYTIRAGERTLLYRENEVVDIEKNTRTGNLDLEEVKARIEARNEELENLTGLTADQRKRVDALLRRLRSSSSTDRLSARDSLVDLQQEFNVLRYLEYRFPETGHIDAPLVLEVMFYIDALNAKDRMYEALEHNFYEVRATAIELLGRLRDQGAVPKIVRGLVDGKLEVRLAAVAALANLGEKNASPAMIEMLGDPDIRISTTCRDALAILWKGELGSGAAPQSASEWTEFIAGHGLGAGAGIRLASLDPLIVPEEEFQDE